MSDLSPLTVEERKSNFGAVRSVNDPKRKSSFGANRANKTSFCTVADGIPSCREEACANVHAHGVALVEGLPEIGPDIDPIRACGGRIRIDFDLVPNRAAFWSTRDMNALAIDYGFRQLNALIIAEAAEN